MSDTYRRYRAIKQAIMQFYQPRPTGHREKHLTTLVALICGLPGGKHAHLPSIADHAPSFGAKHESVINRFRRWLKHDTQTVDGWFLPVAQALLQTLAVQPLVIVMDGSLVGRALPLCWIVVRGKKGHFPEQVHQELLAQVAELMPTGATVTFLGDGEFDGVELQADLRQLGWQYVCRSASNIRISALGVSFAVSAVGPPPGELLAVAPAYMTAKCYGPLTLVALWEQAYKEPLYLVTSLSDAAEAVKLYKKRPHIETFFSDIKSRGFQMHKSHLCDPKRLSRLLISACLAYVWLVYLGVCALQRNWSKRLHRQDRCDLSLFRLGVRLLALCMKECIPLPQGFLVPLALPNR